MGSTGISSASRDVSALANSLRALIDTADPDAACWRDADCGDFLRHQLEAPLREDLSMFFPDADRLIGDAGLATFAEALTSPAASIPVLRMIRQFAKEMSRRPAVYPQKVASVLYFAAIAVALASSHEKITRLRDGEIREGFDWALRQEWIPGSLQDVFRRGTR